MRVDQRLVNAHVVQPQAGQFRQKAVVFGVESGADDIDQFNPSLIFRAP
jgi:hypothetical protein